MDLLKNLNEAQQNAVVNGDGPCLVVAGAGSGKTRVLTYRIAYLLQKGIPARHILALTFTNKAAREMKERIAKLVGEDIARDLWMGTFHSICSHILRAEAEALGYSRNYTIYDTSDTKSLITNIIKDLSLDTKTYKPGNVANRISIAKNKLFTPETYAENHDFQERDRSSQMSQVSDIFRIYQQRLHERNAMDFDDLLQNMVILLQQHPEVCARYQQVFEYVLVDEYQDTNYAQYMIVKMLAEPQNNIYVVGDDAQSIYSFRGASIANILYFQKTYEHSQLFKLEQNYRSTQTIVNAANSLIDKNRGQIPKKIFSQNEVGNKIQVSAHDTEKAEAAFIARTIHSLLQKSTLFADEIAVLYRTNSQSRLLEEAMRKLSMPYRIYGGLSFYQRKIIKDAISYLRFIVNSKDTEALLRIINEPGRGIGNTTINKVKEAAASAHVSEWDIIQQPQKYGLQVSSATINKLQNFAQLILNWQEIMPDTDAYEFACKVFKESNLELAVRMDTSAEGIDNAQNLDELKSNIHQFVEDMHEHGIDIVPITEFLSEVSLLTDQDEHLQDDTKRITLMTVHAAKGLEFKCIFVAGMERDLFPLVQVQSSPKEMEEERRLFYVALTRAKSFCYLTRAKTRFRNGQSTVPQASMFIREIGDEYLEYRESATDSQSKWSSLNKDKWLWDNNQPTHEKTTISSAKTAKKIPVSSLPKKSLNDSTSTAQSQTLSSYNAGMRVHHKTFGDGTVIECFCENGNDKAVVKFDHNGTRTLLLTFAKLDRI